MQRLARTLLSLGALLLGGFGLAFLFWPRWLGAEVALDLTAPAAATDVRAVYGGFELGIALFLGYCATRRETTRLGLLAAVLGTLGFAVGRAIGMVTEGGITHVHLTMLVFEAVTGGLAWFVYARLAPARAA
jgi:hypothetical protein